MNRRCVTCFRDVAIHIIGVSRMLHSSNHNVFMVQKYRKWSFWKLSNRYWRCNIVLSRILRSLRCYCYIQNFQVWETITVLISIFTTTRADFAEKYDDLRLQHKERINVLCVMISLDMNEIRGKEYSITILDL